GPAPAGVETTIFTGRDGYLSCALAGEGPVTLAASRTAIVGKAKNLRTMQASISLFPSFGGCINVSAVCPDARPALSGLLDLPWDALFFLLDHVIFAVGSMLGFAPPRPRSDRCSICSKTMCSTRNGVNYAAAAPRWRSNRESSTCWPM